MPRKLDHAAVVAWLLGICFILLGIPTFAESPGGEEVLGVLGMAGKMPKQFGWIHEMACPSENTLFVAELLNWRVQKLVLHP